jgi:hypothetical protein
MRFLLPLMLAGMATAADLVLSPCDVVPPWTGGGLVVDAGNRQEGAASLVWAGTTASIALPAPGGAERSLTGGDALHLWLHSATASGLKVALTVTSENDASAGWDYFSIQIPLTWTGWRELWLPRSRFGVTRSPLGWDRTTTIGLSRDWGTAGDPSRIDRQDLRIDDLRLGDAPAGQRTAFADLLAAFDDRPALAAIRALLADMRKLTPEG